MNVRFSPHAVRFRITRDELEQLFSGRAVVMHVALPGQHVFQASVATDKFGSWRLDSDPTGFWLSVPRAQLDTFAGGVPTAEGLAHSFELANGGALELTLEVDIQS
jgi:hypothetical protein